VVNMTGESPTERIRRPSVPEIAEELNNIMQTRKGRENILTMIYEDSTSLMKRIKDWVYTELPDLRKQLDLLEAARWDLTIERNELEKIEKELNEAEADIQKAIANLQAEEESGSIDAYFAANGRFTKCIMRLYALIDKIDRRSNDLLKYRDTLVEMVVNFSGRTSS